ncbi:hypothetical protein RUM44_007301 [Polyplax serrata]|uniref:Uncharacterized protein n=1 Tax=Polyplax serrata TaxID=468196 RepID=A0ABR1B098_POLSC
MNPGEWEDEWMDGWMDGWKDGCVEWKKMSGVESQQLCAQRIPRGKSPSLDISPTSNLTNSQVHKNPRDQETPEAKANDRGMGPLPTEQNAEPRTRTLKRVQLDPDQSFSKRKAKIFGNCLIMGNFFLSHYAKDVSVLFCLVRLGETKTYAAEALVRRVPSGKTS